MFCFFGLHSRSLSAITVRRGTTVSLCERCARPLVRRENGRWTAAEPV